MLVDPALVAPVLGGVDRRHQRRAEAPGEVVAGGGDEPVVAVDQVELVAVAEVDAGGEHVGVHPLDPGHELAEIARPRGLEHAVDVDPADALAGRGLLPAAGQDVDLDPEPDERLGELADMPRQPSLDKRGVLPGEDEDSAHVSGRYGSSSGAGERSGARLRTAGSADPGESMTSNRAREWPSTRP